MPLSRTQKQTIIEDMNTTLSKAGVMIVAHNKGLTVAEVSDLRRRMREADATYRVTKNKLALRAMKGTTFEPLQELMKGPTAIATSGDPVSAAKTLVEFAKNNEKLIIIGGAFGERKLAVKDVEMLAKLPSLDELRGKIVGLLQAPAQRIATVLQAPAGQVARVVGAYSKKE